MKNVIKNEVDSTVILFLYPPLLFLMSSQELRRRNVTEKQTQCEREMLTALDGIYVLI